MPTDDLVGELFSDRYRVLKRLGRGGMGLVYEALDEKLRRKVALKLVRPGRDSDTARARFLREIAVTTRLVHPHIITVFDCGEAELKSGTVPFLVLELVSGETLSQLMAKTRIAPELAAKITAEVAAALGEAHQHNVIHGDLKPGNIMLADPTGDVRLLDFGLAKILDAEEATNVTQTGILIGTPRYISPEAVEGVRNDPRSDLYALGVILFEMLTGRPPFEAKNTPMLLLQHLQDPAPRPSQISTRPLPDYLDGLTMALLEKDPARRPQTAGAVIKLLEGRQKVPRGLETFDDDIYDNTETDRSSVQLRRRVVAPGESKAPVGDVAVVVTSVSEGRRLKAEAPSLARQAHDVIEEVLSMRLAAHGGYAFAQQTPQYRFAFPRFADAVAWALDVQKDLVGAPFPEGVLTLPFAAAERDADGTVLFAGLRMSAGIAFGAAHRRLDALTGRQGYVGDVVDSAERLDELALPGEVLIEGARAGDAAVLPDAFITSVERQLEGQRLLRLVPEQLRGRSFARSGVHTGSSSTNIEDDGPLFGRKDIVKNLSDRLRTGGGLITIVGPGGTGKTVVAKEVARRLVGLAPFSGGVWLSSLADCTALSGLVQTIANDVGVGHALGPDTTAEKLAEALAHRGPMVLVLDNLEQATGPAADLALTLVRQNPHLRLLATSREPLAIPHENVVDLGPLPVDDAVELFVARAARPYPAAADRAAIRRVAILLDAMPLAVELAAARTQLMTPQDICARLEERLDFLGDRRRDARQATLHSAIEWSWNLLTDAERIAFAQCAVFRGGFTLEAAEGVLDLSTIDDAPYVLDVVQGLRDKSLLHVIDDGPDIRFDMYRPIKMFAEEKAAALPHMAAIELRHARTIVSRNEELLGSRRGLSGAHAVAEVSLDRNNLLAAAERMGSVDISLARRAALCVAVLYELIGPASQAIPVLEQALGWARTPAERGQVRYHLGRALAARGKTREAIEAYERAAGEAKQGQDMRLLVRVMGSWGRLEHQELRQDRVRDLFEQAAEICAREGLDDLTGSVELERGLIIMASGRFDEAIVRMSDALTLVRHQGDLDVEYRLVSNIGTAHLLAGRPREAMPFFGDAWALAKAMGDRAGEGLVIGNIGGTLLTVGDFPAAVEKLRAAVGIHREVGDRVLEGVDTHYLALALYLMGDIDAAASAFDDALTALANVRKGRELATARCARGLFRLEQGHTEQGVRDIEAGVAALGTLADVRIFGLYRDAVRRLAQLALRFDQGDRSVVDELDGWLAQHEPGSSVFLDMAMLIGRFIHTRWTAS